MRTATINSRQGIIRGAAGGQGTAERRETTRLLHMLGEERGDKSSVRRRGLVLGIELLHDAQFSPGWNFPCYGKGRFSCPGKGHLCTPRLQPRHQEFKMCPGSKCSPFALWCHQIAPAAAQDLIHSGQDAAAPPGHVPSPGHRLQRGTRGCCCCSRSAPSLLETCT